MKHRFLIAALALLVAVPAALAAQDKGTKEEKKTDKPAEASAPKKDEIKPAAAELGKPAPEFMLKDLDGKTVKLSDYKGKTVVLEWFNPECPVITRCHKEGTLKDYATKTMADGVVWLAINSSAPGMQGNGIDKNKKTREEWKLGHTILIDETGDVGRMYGAKTTPHMFVIDTKGILSYRGAIDNAPEGKPEGDKLINYVETALAELKANKPVTTKETKSYGCNVKYATKPGS